MSPHLQHEAVNLDVDMLVRFLRVVELVDLHELLQALPEIKGKEVDPHQAARIQNQLEGIQLGIQVGTRDWKRRRKIYYVVELISTNSSVKKCFLIRGHKLVCVIPHSEKSMFSQPHSSQ